MRIRNIEVEIELATKDMFVKDISAFLLQKAKKIYEKRCFDQVYILEVRQLLWESDITIFSSNLSAHGKVGLILEISYIKYEDWDFAICEIQKIDQNGRMVCTGQTFRANIRPTNQIYKVGRTIPIIIRACQYPLNFDKFSVLGIDFTPVVYPILEILIDPESEKKIANLEETLALEEIVKKLDQEKKGIRKSFDNMISYHDLGKAAGSIKNFDPKPNYVLKITSVRSDDDKYYQFQGETRDYPTFTYLEAHQMLVNGYNKSLRNMVTLLEYYTPEKFAEDEDIWKIYNLNKRK